MTEERGPARPGRRPAEPSTDCVEMRNLAIHLQGLRQASGITLEGLARELTASAADEKRISISTLSRHFQGETLPDRELLQFLYRLLGKSADLDNPTAEFEASLRILFAAARVKNELKWKAWTEELRGHRLQRDLDTARLKLIELGVEVKEGKPTSQVTVPADGVGQAELDAQVAESANELFDEGKSREADELLFKHTERLKVDRLMNFLDLLFENERGAAALRVLESAAKERDLREVSQILRHVAQHEFEELDQVWGVNARYVAGVVSRTRDSKFVAMLANVMENDSRMHHPGVLLYERVKLCQDRDLPALYPLLGSDAQKAYLSELTQSRECDCVVRVILWIAQNDPEKTIDTLKQASTSQYVGEGQRGERRVKIYKLLLEKGWPEDSASVILQEGDETE
ncbi:helix-turn-helix domain-containing protein [Streptomyces sp. CA-210063]|uniref:helix-turn-helix domain-containing protein n=1 Tax=Streptomyces sp. CA-210063 TaxID=2801029 RepID=UPI00214C3102|nr:helix-turn-helix transcriptional regulator [Streptomyces sp. CA-210063]UUU31922.1 helix-turn-helix domain-containing protein [Streptomyces sp. CA-210063]